MKTYEITYISKYCCLDKPRKRIVRGENKTDAWLKLKYQILCTDEYKKLSCVEIKE